MGDVQGLPSASGGPRSGVVALRLSDNMLAGSTGCHEWEAGFSLAELVLSRPELVRGEGGTDSGGWLGAVERDRGMRGGDGSACTRTAWWWQGRASGQVGSVRSCRVCSTGSQCQGQCQCQCQCGER